MRSKSRPVEPTKPVAYGHVRTFSSHGASLDVKPHEGDHVRKYNLNEEMIGLALGSPGQIPICDLPATGRYVDFHNEIDISHACTSPEDLPGALGTTTEIDARKQGIKRKGSKWRSLGNMFTKKDSVSRNFVASPLSHLDTVPVKGPAKHQCAQDCSEKNAFLHKPNDPSTTDRTRTTSSKNTTRMEANALLRRNSSRKKVLHRRRGAEDTVLEGQQLHDPLFTHIEINNDTPAPPPVPTALFRRPIGPLLEVEIPNVKLERYSVMFGDVLGFRPCAKQQPTPQLSLLDRRRGQLKGLQHAMSDTNIQVPFAADCLLEQPHKRQGSGSSLSSRPMKSPSFSLFPPVTSSLRPPTSSMTNKSTSKLNPLSRSTTAPTNLAPPERPQFHKSKSQDQDHVFVIVHGMETLQSNRGRSLDIPRHPSDSTQAKYFGYPDFPVNCHPVLEVDPPMPHTKVAREDFLKRAFPARKSSMKKLRLPLEVPQCPPTSPSDSSIPTAEISIARQISISRQQRQLLIPIAPQLARQPKLMNGTGSPAARKSHHLTLEDA